VCADKKILIVIGLSVLILVGCSASANAMSDAAKQRYLDWVSTRLNDGVAEVFLAVAPNGCTFAYAARIKARAKFQALRRCKKRCGETCVIKDHNGKSAFIKQRGSSASSSTSTSGSSSSSSIFGQDTFILGKHTVSSFRGTDRCALIRFGDFETTGSDSDDLVGNWHHPRVNGKIHIKNENGNLTGRFTGTEEIEPTSGKLTKVGSDLRVEFPVQTWEGSNSCRIEFVLKAVFAKKGSSNYSSGSSSSSSTALSTGTKYDPTIELEYWELVKDSTDLDLLQAYLDEYPNGKFAPLARLKIKKLNSSSGDN